MGEYLKNNLILSLVKLGLMLLTSWFIIVFCFACAVDDLNSGKYDKYILVGGIVLTFSISLVSSYNDIQKTKSEIPKLQADIKSAKKMKNSLLDKANKVVDKYILHESTVMTDVAKARSGDNVSKSKNEIDVTKVETASDFRIILENYPDLKANNSIMKLLVQLESSETRLLSFRMAYSSLVAKYNAKIHTFPFSLFRQLFKLVDVEIEDDEEDVVISDEELGI